MADGQAEDVAGRLRALIAREGPIPLARYMADANRAYYASRDPLGAEGDFITAPEISQMFGELIGLALADAWSRVRVPAAYVELGPGRGTLAADALRAAARAGLRPPVHFVENSPTLRDLQAQRVPEATWHEDVDSLPDDVPLLIVANEFFDALPIRQYIRSQDGWRELMVGVRDDAFVLVPGPETQGVAIPEPLRSNAQPGAIFEASPASTDLLCRLAERLVRQGGVMIAIDYGHSLPALGDTLQAVRGHSFADPFKDPGEHDLTAHVDFSSLLAAAAAYAIRCDGPVEQGDWLVALGIDIRAEQLRRARPDRAAEITAARMRLIHPEQMGTLFKVVGFSGTGWPPVPGLQKAE